MTINKLNHYLFLKINALQGKNPWADAFGRAGAEFVIVAMAGWFVVADYIVYGQNKIAFVWPILFLSACWTFAWLLNLGVAFIVREPRPQITDSNVKLLFQPILKWKSFPSDHAMSAWLIFGIAFVFGLPGVWALFVMAVWVSWGRVYSGVHYPGDILAGALVAAIVSFACHVALSVL